MGLDIRVYSGLKKNEELSALPKEDKDFLDNLYMNKNMEYISIAFPYRESPLKYDDSVYDAEDEHRYNIGSYSTYNWFRRTLEGFSNDLEKVYGGGMYPFYLLTNFPDCEGVIGTNACKKLCHEFYAYEDGYKFSLHNICNVAEVDVLSDIYDKFKDAFDYASREGAVLFC